MKTDDKECTPVKMKAILVCDIGYTNPKKIEIPECMKEWGRKCPLDKGQ